MSKTIQSAPSHETTPTSYTGTDWSILEKLAGKYSEHERARIDRMKADIESKPWNNYEFERQKIDVPPSFARKIGRLALDAFGIRSQRSETRRDREAMSVALQEHRNEQETQQRKVEEERERQRVEAEQREAKYQAWKAEQEQKALERDLSTARDHFDYHKHERFHNQRTQEIAERNLNANLLTVERLEEEVLSENPKVDKQFVPYNDDEIPIYNLRGFPFSMLTHTVDYRHSNKPGEIGTETYRAVMNNPAIWTDNRYEAEQSSGFGTRNGNARGDTISASYTNSKRNFGSRANGELIYGFDHVDADSIISVSNGDGGTSNMSGKSETMVSRSDEIDVLEGAGGTNIYNEVLLRRYSETGIPKLPDYIIAENGKITETMLQHAKYFKIPIINIDSQIYTEQMRRHGEELIDSISENDDYKDLDKKIAELSSLSEYKFYYHDLRGIGRDYDIPRRINLTQTEQRCLDVAKLEMSKRIEFIENTLKSAIAEVRTATERGESAKHEPTGFDRFDICVMDIQNRVRSTKYSDESDGSYSAAGNCNRIQVDFRLKGSSRNVETEIYDGEHIIEFEKALSMGLRTHDDIDNADSSFYNRIIPLVNEYFLAFRENTAMIKG